MKKTFNLYCDESSHLPNDRQPFMLLSYVGSPYNDKNTHSQFLKELKIKHHFSGEIKWTDVSNSMLPFYVELVNYFFESTLFFRSIIIEKKQIDYNSVNFDSDEFYYKMYYQLLHHKMDSGFVYNVYVDIKDTRGAKKIKRLTEILNAKEYRVRNLQLIHSYESNIMQLCDFMMGALNYNLRGNEQVLAKKSIISLISELAQIPLNSSTPKSSTKFNLFFIDFSQSASVGV